LLIKSVKKKSFDLYMNQNISHTNNELNAKISELKKRIRQPVTVNNRGLPSHHLKPLIPEREREIVPIQPQSSFKNKLKEPFLTFILYVLISNSTVQNFILNNFQWLKSQESNILNTTFFGFTFVVLYYLTKICISN